MLEEDDQSTAFSSKAGFKAAFLEPKFDHKAALVAAEESGLEGAEAADFRVKSVSVLKDGGFETSCSIQLQA